MVKCADCGFLAVRHLETRDLREAEGSYRDTGEIPRDLNRPKHLYEEVPLCFERLRIFDPQRCTSAAERQEVVQEEIGHCVGFTEWHHGFTPKEHRELLDREYRLRRDEELRQQVWDREDTRDAAMRRQLGEQHRTELLVFGLLATLALTIASIAAAIVDGAVSRGWQPGWWPF